MDSSQPLALEIEMFLLMRGDWISVVEICQRFGIEERLLRADGKRRPLCRHFAISSSTKGFKHLRFATVAERLQYKHARRRTAIAYLRALREYDAAVRNCLTGKFPDQIEALTGQQTLFPLYS